MNANAEPHCLPPEIFHKSTSLIYGIGNAGRQDDGLGWAFIDRLEQYIPAPSAHLRRSYQLGFEDADLINRYTRVLFVDATKDQAVESFTLSRPEPKLDLSFTSHAISVQAILATTQRCFAHIPDVYLLAIRGYEWELQEGLTGPAQRNLEDSLDLILGLPCDIGGVLGTRSRTDHRG
jgi:hydrogenase maturation protease